jgi:hypothetical protein
VLPNAYELELSSVLVYQLNVFILFVVFTLNAFDLQEKETNIT